MKRLSAITRACGLALAVGACASANTPEQNLAYERWTKCARPYVELEQVQTNGRISFMFTNAATREEVLQCLAEAGRAGPTLPDPFAFRPTGGQ